MKISRKVIEEAVRKVLREKGLKNILRESISYFIRRRGELNPENIRGIFEEAVDGGLTEDDKKYLASYIEAQLPGMSEVAFNLLQQMWTVIGKKGYPDRNFERAETKLQAIIAKLK